MTISYWGFPGFPTNRCDWGTIIVEYFKTPEQQTARMRELFGREQP